MVDGHIDTRECLAGWRAGMHHLVAAVGAELVACLPVGQQLREDLLLERQVVQVALLYHLEAIVGLHARH